jgi:RHS repeat-associated protein
MRKTTTTVVVMATLALVSEAVANNNWSTSYRGGTVSLPSADESASNRGTGVAVNHGRVGYSIPIQVPPGFAGVTPELAIEYTSSRVEGALGGQWALAGVPTLAVRTSGRGGQPLYGTGVTYLGFSGEELVLVDSAGDIDGDGTDDATYREERDRLFARYIERSAGGWLVQYPDGRKLTLGTTSVARIARPDPAFADQIWMWLPEKLEDPQGNQMIYRWADAATVLADPSARSDAARYLTEIRYGCRACATASSYQRVAFTYAARSSAGVAAAVDARPGFVVEWEGRLTSIDTFSNTAAGGSLRVRTYALGYASDTRRLLLSTVDTTGADGSTLPRLSFTYTDEDASASPTSTVQSVPRSGGNQVRFAGDVFAADMDKDGRIDLVKCQAVSIGTYRWWRNVGTDTVAFDPTGSTYPSPPPVCPSPSEPVSLEDGNRDLGIDVHDFRSIGGGVEIFEFVDAATGWISAGNAVVSTAGVGDDLIRQDANRDGYIDLLTTGSAPWMMSFDDSTYDYTLDEVACDGTGGAGFSPTNGLSVLSAGDSGVVMGDFTGDDLAETLFFAIGSTTDASANVLVWPGRGRGCFGFLGEDGHGATPYTTTTITAAVNGVSNVLPDPASIQAADVNGDGFDDIVWLDDPGNRVGVWTFDPTEGFTPLFLGNQTITGDRGCRVADLDGDGASEILCSDSWTLYDFADGQPHHLETVSNGRGVTTTIGYTTSSRMAADAEAAGASWVTNVGASMRFANVMTVDDGRDGREIRTYVARDAYYKRDTVLDLFEVVGFGYVEETRTPHLYTGTAWLKDERDPGRTTRTWYDVGATEWPLRGATLCQETWTAGTAPASYSCGAATGALSRLELDYTLDEDASGVSFITATARDEHVLEGTAGGHLIRSEQLFDDHGNEVVNVAWGLYDDGEPNHGNDEAMTVTDWITDTSTWRLRSPKRVMRGGVTGSTAAPAIAVKAASFFYYDGNTAWDVTANAGGLRTETRHWACDPTVVGDPRCADPGNDASAAVAEQIQYTAAGLVDTLTDAEGVVTRSAYDAAFGLFLTSKTLDPGGLQLTTTFAVDPRHGGPIAMTGPDGQTTRAAYDALGRMIALARPGDTLTSPTIVRRFFDRAPISRVVDVAKDGTPDGLQIAVYLDGLGRTLCRTREAASDLIHVEEQKEWSALGNVMVDAVPYSKAPGAPVWPCKPSQVVAKQTAASRRIPGAIDEHTVDAMGRKLAVAHSSDGSRKTWGYSPLQVTLRDEEDNAAGVHAGTARTQIYDGRGKITAVIERHLFADVDPGSHSFRYAYAFDGELERVLDSTGALIHTALYDARRRLVRSVDATRGTTTFVRDEVGRITSTTDARGEVVNHAYDGAGRLESVEDSAGTTAYRYDTHPDPASTGPCNTAGRLSHVEYPAGETTYCYDRRGRTQGEETVVHSLGAASHETTYAWDSLDRLAVTEYPDDTRALYTYGADGWLDRLVAWSGTGITHTVVSDVQYSAWGAPLSVALGNGATLSYLHDGRARPQRSIAESGSAKVQNLGLVLDLVGNVTAIDDTLGFASATYVYDDLYRLVEASGARYGGETASYEYDRLGNLTRKAFTDAASPLDIGALTYAHPTIPSAVTSAGGQSFAYDAMGNLTGDGSHSFTYTPSGSLHRALDLAGVEQLELEYDHRGRRIGKLAAGGDSVHYFGGAELREQGGASSWIKSLTVGGRLVARFEDSFTLANVADHVFYVATDHLGSPTLVMDTAGAVIERYDYHPFGEESLYSLEAADQASGTTEFTDAYRAPGDPTSKLTRRFQGREVDSELGMYDFGARIYRPDLGRFMTADSVVPDGLDSQSWNRHAFVRNNPLAFVDPSGHADAQVTATGKDTEFWTKDMLEDVGGGVPHGYSIDGLDPVRQFAMNYLNDARDKSNVIVSVPEGHVINNETSISMSAEIDAIFKANVGVSAKQIVDGYHFMYSYTNADGNLVTKTLTLDPNKWSYTRTTSGGAGVGGTFKLGEYGGGGASMSAGGQQTMTGTDKSVRGLYTSRFVSQERAAGGYAWEMDEYAPDPARPTSGHSHTHKEGLVFDPVMQGGTCPGDCHLPRSAAAESWSSGLEPLNPFMP